MTQLKVYRRSELEAVRPTTDSTGCLARYKALWVDGVEDSSDISLVGIGFHAIQHRYVMALVENKLGQDQELAQQAFIAGAADVAVPSRLLPELRNLWEWHAESFELPLERFVAAEERGEVGDVGFTPDLVLAHPEANALEIIDLKSGWAPPLTEAEVKGLFQARVYSKYAQDRWPGFSAYRFTIVAVRFRKATTVTFTSSELDAVELEIRAAIQTIEDAHRTNNWPYQPGPSCRFCELPCPVADRSDVLPKRLSVQQYQQLGAWLLVAEKQLRSAKKLMKASCAAYGPLMVNGVEWNNRPSVSRAYPIGPLLDVLKMRGLMGAFDEDQGYTISHSALSKLFKQFPDLEGDLKSVVQSKTSYRFSAKQPVNPDAPALGEGEEE